MRNMLSGGIREWTSRGGSVLAVDGAAESQRLELAMERRALHADERRGPRNVAAEADDLRGEILALEYLARLAERQAHHLVALLPAQNRRRDVENLGRQHV